MASNAKSEPIFLFCRLSWYFCNNGIMSFSVISYVSLPIINSSHMLLVYITRFSSKSGFRETKEISADNCNFHSPFAL